ncbi:MAG: exodeoxyribonuclease [Actinomycetota bacterium]|nr:exodeoxyribonuclease Xth [Cryptosporangiaceae bacterium]MDQ1675838.1 exodeoxyribonuclease [Actinomycetota bacterium]
MGALPRRAGEAVPSLSVLRVATANVNGIRAAAKKGFGAWLATRGLDVVCLQEVRAIGSEIPAGLFDGWHGAHAESVTKGRCGVSVLTRERPTAVRVGFGSAEFDPEGRYVEVDLAGVTVGSLYLPKGGVGTPRQDAKYRFMTEFAAYLKEARDRGRELLVCGDWNIAHTEADIKSWKTNLKSSGFLPEERAWLGEVFTDFVDVVRARHPDSAGPYTWWSYRGRAFDNDAGWRIDHHVATPDLAGRARCAVVDRAASYDTRWSDHSAVVVDYGD